VGVGVGGGAGVVGVSLTGGPGEVGVSTSSSSLHAASGSAEARMIARIVVFTVARVIFSLPPQEQIGCKAAATRSATARQRV
jgi:hypothetical protein